MNGKIYQFEDYLLDVSEQRLQKNGVDISLPPKVFEVLTVLVKRPQQLVTYQELMEEVWQDTFVEETNLRYSIHALRKVFPELIETVPKRGYRFNAKVALFTKEEFIKLHTGSFKKDELMDLVEETPPKLQSAFRKYSTFAVIGLLMTGIGILGYYFWQSGKKDSKNFKTVAVLPFSVIGESSEKTVESQKGLADALVFNLNKIRGLKVIPTNEIQNLFGKDFDGLQAGKNLNAEEVLVGTYRTEGNLVQINFQLLQVSNGETILTKSFTVNKENRIEAESSIALQIARQIDFRVAYLKDESRIKELKLSEETKKSYLAARKIARENDFDRWKEATDLMKKVVTENPNWALGYAGYAETLAFTHGDLAVCVESPKIAQRAIELDSTLAEAYLVLGFCHQFNWEWKEAEQNYNRAIELNPNLARTYLEYGEMLDFQRRFGEAEIYLKKAVELEPLKSSYFASLCRHYYYDLNFNDALKHCYQAERIEPGHLPTRKNLQWIYVQQNRYDEVLKLTWGHLSREYQLKEPEAKALIEGNMQKYWEIIIEKRKKNPNRRFSPLAIAVFYAKLGDKEKTLEFLEKGTEKLQYQIYQANPEPIFNFIRKEPRFIEAIKKINLQP